MDLLTIKALKVDAQIGIYAWEQRIKQSLLIDIQIEADFSRCQEDINNTINYAALCEAVTSFVSSKSFHLIETVAHEVAQLIEQQFNVERLCVAVSKPQAIKNAENVQITVRRDKLARGDHAI